MANIQTGWTEDKEINWDAISTEAPPPLPPGIYQATIVKAEPRATAKGDPAISLQLRITSRYGESPDTLSRVCFDNLGFGGAAFKIKQLAQTLEILPPPSTGMAAVGEFCADLVASGPVWVRTKIESYQPPATEADPNPAPKVNAKINRYLTEDQAAPAAEAMAATPERPTRKG